MTDGLLVPFQRPARGPLRAPAQGDQQLPNMTGMIADTELLFDKVGHTRAGPQRGFISQWLGAFQQQAMQPFAITLAQLCLFGKAA